MNHSYTLALTALFASACFAESATVVDAGGSDGSSTGALAATAAPLTTAGLGDDGATSTGDPPPPSSDDTGDEGSTDAGGTASGSTSGTHEDDASSTSDGSSGSGSSTGGEPDPFGDCYDDKGAMLCPGQSCVIDVGGTLSACTPDCIAGTCEVGTCVGPIADQGVADICILPCTTDDDCDGVCGDTSWTTGGEPILACMWP